MHQKDEDANREYLLQSSHNEQAEDKKQTRRQMMIRRNPLEIPQAYLMLHHNKIVQPLHDGDMSNDVDEQHKPSLTDARDDFAKLGVVPQARNVVASRRDQTRVQLRCNIDL